MDFKLMYITNDTNLSKIAEDSGVDWIFVDLEINGKMDRQGHLDTVISKHSIEDVKKIKSSLNKAELLVRVNPINLNSKYEINKVIDDGADIVMLPYFKTTKEVQEFVNLVNGRSKVCLLLETKEAVETLDSILKIKGIDYIHIGLNDLHLSYKLDFMFELLSNNTVDLIINKIKETKIKYGFGGIANLGEGDLPSEYILNEHIRLGSSMAILSRSFYMSKNSSPIVKEIFEKGIEKIRKYIYENRNNDIQFFEDNKKIVEQKVNYIVSKRKGK